MRMRDLGHLDIDILDLETPMSRLLLGRRGDTRLDRQTVPYPQAPLSG